MKRRLGARTKFRSSPKNKNGSRRMAFPIVQSLLLVVILGWFAITILKLLFPFETWNPFEKKITIGDPAIAEWKYGGVNHSGDLLFYNNFNVVALPANQERFDAAGNYILIKGHSSDTLTIESEKDYLGKLSLIPITLVIASIGGYFLIKSPTGKRSLPRTRTMPKVSIWKASSRNRSMHHPSSWTGSGGQHSLHSWQNAWRWKWKVWTWKSRYRR